MVPGLFRERVAQIFYTCTSSQTAGLFAAAAAECLLLMLQHCDLASGNCVVVLIRQPTMPAFVFS